MDRREFVRVTTLGRLSAPLAAEAQHAAKVARIGWLGTIPRMGDHHSAEYA
jgi:hypothetical protein